MLTLLTQLDIKATTSWPGVRYTELRPEHPGIKGQTSSGRYTLPKILGNAAAEQVILEVKRDASEELVLADMRG